MINFNFTIPSSSVKKEIYNTEGIVEGIYSGFNRITDYAVLKGAGGNHSRFYGCRDYPHWYQDETDDYTDHDDLYYGISPAQLIADAYYHFAYSEDKTVGTRLMVDYQTILEYGKKVKNIKNEKNVLIDIFEFGKYPQSIVNDKRNDFLNDLYLKGSLKKTGRTYSYNTGSVNSALTTEQDLEYEHNGKRYVRVKRTNSDAVLKNGTKLTDDYYWVKVEPIRWYVNHDSKIAITIKTLIGGVPYNINPVNGLKGTYLDNFIKKVFNKDFCQDQEFSKTDKKTKISKDAIRIIKKVGNHDNEIGKEIGKCFDKEVKKAKKTKVKKIIK